jgi:hypothetical protein
MEAVAAVAVAVVAVMAVMAAENTNPNKQPNEKWWELRNRIHPNFLN